MVSHMKLRRRSAIDTSAQGSHTAPAPGPPRLRHLTRAQPRKTARRARPGTDAPPARTLPAAHPCGQAGAPLHSRLAEDKPSAGAGGLPYDTAAAELVGQVTVEHMEVEQRRGGTVCWSRSCASQAGRTSGSSTSCVIHNVAEPIASEDLRVLRSGSCASSVEDTVDALSDEDVGRAPRRSSRPAGGSPCGKTDSVTEEQVAAYIAKYATKAQRSLGRSTGRSAEKPTSTAARSPITRADRPVGRRTKQRRASRAARKGFATRRPTDSDRDRRPPGVVV